MAQNVSSPAKSTVAVQQLEQLKQRVEALATRSTRAQVQLETSRQQYAEAVEQAERDYKTSDISELREKLASAEIANAKAVEDFAHAVAEFEKFIERIEHALANPEAMAAMVAAMPALAPAKPEAPAATAPSFAAGDI